MRRNPHKELWCAVLHSTVLDALNGADSNFGEKQTRINETKRARDYLTGDSRDFREVCEMAGFDPSYVREQMCKLIANAPTIEELFDGRPKRSFVAEKKSAKEKPPKRSQPRVPDRKITYNGETLTIKEWSERTGLSVALINSRHCLRRWTPEETLTRPQKYRPPKPKGRWINHNSKRKAWHKPRHDLWENRELTCNGETLTASQWSERTGLTIKTIKGRIARGWSVERTLTERPRARGAYAPGVGSNLCASLGTGAGTAAQDRPKISFSESEVS